MISAKKAREEVENSIKNSSDGIRADIDKRISDAITGKKFYIHVCKMPTEEERRILKKVYTDLGYTWKYECGGFSGSSDSIKISW